MSASVRVERVSDLPEGQPVIVEPHPDGETIIYVQAGEISSRAADGISSGLTRAKRSYQAAGLLRCTAV